MVFIYGGANTGGSANNSMLDGAKLAQKGVMVVTANHRLGVMGFMAHPELSKESSHSSSGNYALLDILMALQWIQENALQFGGDPKNVTLFGQSSGAFDIQLLMASPLSKGLFHRAITESGQMTSYYSTMAKAQAEQIGQTIANNLKAPSGSTAPAFLRGLPASDVLKASASLMSTGLDTETGLLTCVDGWVLPKHPVQVFAKGEELPIPLIAGSNAREISMPYDNATLRSMIRHKYGDSISDSTYALATQAVNLYGISGDTAPPADPLFGSADAQWMTDTVQRCGTVTISRYHSAKYPTYQYLFDRVIPGSESRGSYHGAEVVFVFGTLDRPGNTVAWTDKDRTASDIIQQYWTNFAKTGDPNGGSLMAWPKYTQDTAKYMEFLVDGQAVNATARAPYCDLFGEWVKKYMNVSSW